MEFNRVVNQIKELRKAKRDSTELQEKSKGMKAGIKAAEEAEKELALARDAALLDIGNLVHDTVPVSDDEVRRGWRGTTLRGGVACGAGGVVRWTRGETGGVLRVGSL